MSGTLTVSDRQSLIRLASTMEKGSEERKAILAGLSKKGFDMVDAIDLRGEVEDSFQSMLPNGVRGEVDEVVEISPRDAVVTAFLSFDLRKLKTPKDVATVVEFLMKETQGPTAAEALSFMTGGKGYGHPILKVRF